LPSSQVGENLGEEGEATFYLDEEPASQKAQCLWMGKSHRRYPWDGTSRKRQYRVKGDVAQKHQNNYLLIFEIVVIRDHATASQIR
jgi:hypothetical protein